MRCTLLCLVSVLLTGCAFEPGDPWASATFDLRAVFDEAGRTEGARLRTAQDYRVVLDKVDVRVTSARLNLAAEGTAAFDPANPPPGFSLCHNGHCHAADGSLVDYEDVAAAAGGGGAPSTVQAIDAQLTLTDQPQELPLGPCTDDCNVARGALVDVQLDTQNVVLTGRAFDSREPSRLPEEGIPFVVEVQPPTLRSLVTGTVGEGYPVDLRIDGTLTVSAAVLDSFDFERSTEETTIETDGLDWSVVIRR